MTEMTTSATEPTTPTSPQIIQEGQLQTKEMKPKIAESYQFIMSGGKFRTELLPPDPSEVFENVDEEPPDSSQPDFSDTTEFLSRQVASWFVRSKNQFFMVEKPGTPFTQTDARRICVQRFRARFPDIELTNALERDVFQRAIIQAHEDPEQSVPIWNGSTRCSPAHEGAIIREDETVALNTWQLPEYRTLKIDIPNLAMLDELLSRIFCHDVDRRVFIDWLSWCLQNEADKPAWSVFLYSRKKGTGKSTLCDLVSRLFGKENSITQNSITKLTGRFNKPILDSKLVISEELQLKPDSPQGNTLKTYITEKVTVSEAKGREVEKVKQYCCFLFTSNHLPLWIEADERRYYVIDVDHDGHASGPQAEEFGSFIAEFNEWMERPENIASLYQALMERQQSNDFNPRSLNLSLVGTPVMQQIIGSSREVLLVRLEELLASLGVFAVPQERLAKLFTEQLKTNQNRIRHMMPELGWRSETAKWGGVDHRRAIWIHPDYQVSGGRVQGPDGYDEPVSQVEEEVELI
ncbi:primase-helicase family protein [Thiosulfatihalobacter marinus]|uniref:primase-helicase family protein n=1 Tax=Thiosulfatihalobacter marinus TaxID=2792481 RepID=UPI0018D67D04|nr:DUF5906 domain-containing protein [Thiosulfatihalobacter marinus]